jgi:hypothetical protein
LVLVVIVVLPMLEEDLQRYQEILQYFPILLQQVEVMVVKQEEHEQVEMVEVEVVPLQMVLQELFLVEQEIPQQHHHHKETMVRQMGTFFHLHMVWVAEAVQDLLLQL